MPQCATPLPPLRISVRCAVRVAGSELLMLIPSLKGIVGPVVLPILGAVPDGAIVIFSGLGPIAEAQDQVATTHNFSRL